MIPIVSAQLIPPSALKTKNRRKDIPLPPAIQAAVTRTSATQRPKNTALAPWRAKKRSPALRTSAALVTGAAAGLEDLAPAVAADQEADVVADDRPRRGDGDDPLDREVAARRRDRPGHERGLPGEGTPIDSRKTRPPTAM